MKNVVFVTFAYEESGGTIPVINNLIKHYESKSYKNTVIVITEAADPSIYNEDPSIKRIYLNTPIDFNLLRTLHRYQKLLNELNPDRIFFILGHPFIAFLSNLTPIKYQNVGILYYMDPWFTFSNLKEEVRKPVQDFIQIRDSVINKKPKSVYNIFTKTKLLDSMISTDVNTKELYDNILGILVCSEDVKDYFSSLSQRKDIVLMDHLYLKEFPKTDESLWLSSEKPTFIYTGRVTSSWKGFGVVLKALQSIDFDYVLKLFLWDDVEADVAKELFNKYHLPISKLKTYSKSRTLDFLNPMAQATAVLIPSIGEGFSYTMLESMSVGGTTVVGPIYGGPKDVIKDGINGFRFKPGDGEDLSEVLKNIIIYDKNSLIKIKKNAVESAKQFTFKKYIDKIETKFPL